MKYKIEIYGALCACSKFIINGIDADADDFGERHDWSPETAEDYGCGDMRFTPKPATQEVLDKYHINTDEYNIIAEKLRGELSFGDCGWCV